MKALPEYSLDQLLLAFLNLKPNKAKGLQIICKYGQTKFSNSPLDYRDTELRLSDRYQLDFRYSGGNQICLPVINIANKDLEGLLSQIYEEIQARFANQYSIQELRQCIPIALYGLRGSADFTLKKYTVDINLDSDMQKSRIQSLLRKLPDLNAATQFNPPREDRMSQIRTTFIWMRANSLREVANLNNYKASILANEGLLP
jgi:hypothetical protein